MYTLRVEPLQLIADAILGHRFHFSGETELQDGIGLALAEAGIEAEREVRLTLGERIDFMAGGVGIEVKVKGSRADLMRQALRYARCDEVSGLLIVTTLARHKGVPEALNGKPVVVVHLEASSF